MLFLEIVYLMMIFFCLWLLFRENWKIRPPISMIIGASILWLPVFIYGIIRGERLFDRYR